MKAREQNVLSRITQAVQEQGGRMTEARKSLVSVLLKSSEPVSIATIVKKSGLDEVGVYRNISYLIKLGFVEEVLLANGVKTYAIAHDHHDHIVCRKCHVVRHIHCDTHSRHATVSHKDFNTIETHTLTYYGLCAKCAH